MNIQTIELACTGYSIIADWYEGSDSEILLVLPGYSSTRARQKYLVSVISKTTGASALVIDYSGHGDSPFELRDTRPAQHLLEAVTAFDWVKNNYPNSKISILGSSYGGFLATHLTKYREFDKLVLKVPAIYQPESFYDLWAVRLGREAAYKIATNKFRTNTEALSKHPLLAYAPNFKGKTLVIVHDEDEMVPKETTAAYINAFGADSFVEPNFAHSVVEVTNETRVTPQQLLDYQMKIANWLKSN